MARPRRRPPRVIAAGVGLMLLFIVGACSSTSKKPAIGATEAANTVGSVFDVPADQQACLEQAFRQQPSAAGALATSDTASPDQLEALGRLEVGCIPAATVADAIVTGAGDSGDGGLTPEQQTCLRDAVGRLADGDRARLMAGLTVPSSLDDASVAELGQVTDGLLQACQISGGDTGTVVTR